MMRYIFVFLAISVIMASCQSNCAGQKPGCCPPIKSGQSGICVEACSGDCTCKGNMKCCSNGCGHVCTYPVFY